MMSEKLKKLRHFSITGSEEKFGLAERIFHIFMFHATWGCVANFFANILIGMPWVMHVVNFFVTIVIFAFYYLSRAKQKFSIVLVPQNIFLKIVMSLVWFANGGIQSAIGYLLFIPLFINVVVSRYPVFHTLLGLLHIYLLITLEALFPTWVIPYPDAITRYLDICISISWAFMMVAMGVYEFRKNYEREQQKVLQQKETLAKQAHTLALQNSSLERANEIQNRLFSLISHDVRAPLNSLTGALGLLKEGNLTTDEIQMIAGNLYNDVQKTSQLVDNLLQWSLSQRQGIEAQPVVFDLVPIIQEKIELLSPIWKQKRLKIVFNAPPLWVYADSDMVGVVIHNLLGNAIKFSFQEGNIRIQTDIDQHQAWVSVQDNGIGISAENQAKLFGEAYHSTMGTANEKGSGLGLSLCKAFILQNQGQIGVESTPNQGAKFFFSLPLASHKENNNVALPQLSTTKEADLVLVDEN
ncbi:MAG TPA: hypothetical protein DCM08_12505 [Microscillaceae bacterium]|nr:hypothetical protein [Microscillaceae bacterium]